MTVFANGLEIACKAQANQVIAAFPYVCMTPPQTPATPPGVPVPYPTFGMDGDTDKGTSTVKIGGKTVTQKNKSYYTKCTGNEAGCAPKKNLITSVNKGKEYAHAWSGNVKMDAEPISRFADLSSNDHASPIAGGAPSVKIGKPGAPGAPNQMKCIVGEYAEKQAECAAQNPPGQFHHVIPDRCFRSGRVKVPGQKTPRNIRMNQDNGFPSHGEGICICLPPQNHCGTKAGKAAGDFAVHADLDDKLTKLGTSRNRGSRNRGLAKLKKVRRQSFASLAKLVKKGVLDEDCYKLAVEEVKKATKDIENADIRAEKSLSNVSSSAAGRMNNQ